MAFFWGFPAGLIVKKKKKNLPANAGDKGSIPRRLHVPQSNKACEPHCWACALHLEKPPQREAHTLQRWIPALGAKEKPTQQRPSTAKKIQKILLKNKKE